MGAGIPIQAGDYYVAAIEANGNLTVLRGDDGLLLFGPDDAYQGVTSRPAATRSP